MLTTNETIYPSDQKRILLLMLHIPIDPPLAPKNMPFVDRSLPHLADLDRLRISFSLEGNHETNHMFLTKNNVEREYFHSPRSISSCGLPIQNNSSRKPSLIKFMIIT